MESENIEPKREKCKVCDSPLDGYDECPQGCTENDDYYAIDPDVPEEPEDLEEPVPESE